MWRDAVCDDGYFAAAPGEGAGGVAAVCPAGGRTGWRTDAGVGAGGVARMSVVCGGGRAGQRAGGERAEAGGDSGGAAVPGAGCGTAGGEPGDWARFWGASVAKEVAECSLGGA